METIYLTRRNLLTLLSKLDLKKSGEPTECGILKLDRIHPRYPCSVASCIIALEDEEYYTDRPPGEVRTGH